MDRLGFVKTIEAILAAIIIMSMYGIVNTHIIEQVGTYRRNPTTLMNDFINMIEENGLINDAIINYDYSKLDSVFHKMFPRAIYYYFEPNYYERIKVKSAFNKTEPNISFVYNFPLGVDENSVRVTNDQYELPTNVLFNYYATPISFNSDLNNSYVEVNITINAPGIDNKTLLFYVNNKKSLLDINNWTVIDYDSYYASLILFIPEVKSNVRTYVYSAQNNSLFNTTYPSLSKTVDVNYTQFNTYKTTTGQVVFTPENISSVSDDTYYISYTLYSDLDDNYYDISIINNSGVIITPELDYLKEGAAPIYTTLKGEYSIKRIFQKDGGFLALNVYGGYS